MTNSDLAILIDDLSAADAIHVHTRLRFTYQDLCALSNIPGITSYHAGDRTYTTSVHANMRGNYCNSVSKGRLFTFNELAPQILLVFADAMGVEPEQITVTTSPSGGHREISSGEWVVEAARKLRPKTAPAPRNPIAPFAATLDDMQPGTELMKVSYSRFDYVDTVTVENRPAANNLGFLCLFPGRHFDHWFLEDMGIVPSRHNPNVWNNTYVTIVNTTENRRKLVEWLMARNNKSAHAVAEKIIKLYIADFVSVDTSRLPKGIGVNASITVT